MTGFDEPYDKMMKRIEESGYYSSHSDDKLERLLPRVNRVEGTNEDVPDTVKPEDLGEENFDATD